MRNKQDKDRLLKYSMQLAMLKQLLNKKLITREEYELIKKNIMIDYKIVSEITA